MCYLLCRQCADCGALCTWGLTARHHLYRAMHQSGAPGLLANSVKPNSYSSYLFCLFFKLLSWLHLVRPGFNSSALKGSPGQSWGCWGSTASGPPRYWWRSIISQLWLKAVLKEVPSSKKEINFLPQDLQPLNHWRPVLIQREPGVEFNMK